MKASITRRQRSLLFFLSASAYIAWFSGVGVRLEAQGVVGAEVSSMTIAPKQIPLRLSSAIHRDPFQGAPTDRLVDASSALSGTGRFNDTVPPTATQDRSDLGPVVPNISGIANDAPPAAAIALVVRGTIVGKNSVAYVANGSEMDIVRVGDSLGDRRIVSINLEGIAFADGSRLDLADVHDTQPAPRALKATSNSITLRLDQLRRLFARASSDAPPRRDPRSPTLPTEAQTLVTPAPLRTVDARGLAPGVNPTPDLSDPTAFPYPYPYAPARH